MGKLEIEPTASEENLQKDILYFEKRLLDLQESTAVRGFDKIYPWYLPELIINACYIIFTPRIKHGTAKRTQRATEGIHHKGRRRTRQTAKQKEPR